jgi:predicted RNA-binding protein (virulence factor B family)
MKDKIGTIAGEIWQFLDENGASSVTKIATATTGASKNDIQRAIGWLFKEDKLIITQKGRTETLALK